MAGLAHMRSARRLRLAAATAMGIVLVAVAAFPAVRHIASGWWNRPDKLAALTDNPQVHYEDGALDRARTVAALLPAAIARIEFIHRRPFAHPVTIGVYVSPEAFAAANAGGYSGSVGLAFLDRVILSPDLFARQRQRLPAILTHEIDRGDRIAADLPSG